MHRRRGAVNSRAVSPLSSGGLKSRIEEVAGLVPSDGCEGTQTYLLGLQMAVTCLLYLFTLSPLSVCLCIHNSPVRKEASCISPLRLS